MSSWPTILLPALATALLVRLDSKLIGPYFALSELIPGTGGAIADVFYSDRTLRRGFVRRLLYPFLLGVILHSMLSVPVWEAGITGLLAAGLLLWPMVFHGLPERVSRRDWELPVLYGSFSLAYGTLAVSGALVWQLVEFASDGDLKRWIADQLLGTFGFWIAAIFLSGAYTATSRRLRSKVEQRFDIDDD